MKELRISVIFQNMIYVDLIVSFVREPSNPLWFKTHLYDKDLSKI